MNDKIIRILSTGVLISSAAFGKQSAAKQTETLAMASASKLPFVFVDSFATLSNTKKLAERLLAGEDVTLEMEFNDITLSDDDKKGLELVRPLLERLNALKPKVEGVDIDAQFGEDAEAVRDWMNGSSNYYSLPRKVQNGASKAERNVLRIQGDNIENISGNTVSKARFQVALNVMRKNREEGKLTGTRWQHDRYETRNITVNADGTIVKVGCQSFLVGEVERIATQLGL